MKRNKTLEKKSFPTVETVQKIREILESNEDKTHMGIALALSKAGLSF